MLFELTKTITATRTPCSSSCRGNSTRNWCSRRCRPGRGTSSAKAPSPRSWTRSSAGCSCTSRDAPPRWATWSRSSRAAAAAAPRPWRSTSPPSCSWPASRPVLLVDLDPHYGSVAQYLDVQGKYGIAHILNREGTIDRHLVESSVVRYAEGLDVLLSPAAAEADKHKPMNYDNLLRVLEACRESHGYVVVDAPRLPHEAAVYAGLGHARGGRRAASDGPRRGVRQVADRIADRARHGAPTASSCSPTRPGGAAACSTLSRSSKALGSQPLFRVRTDCRKAAQEHQRTGSRWPMSPVCRDCDAIFARSPDRSSSGPSNGHPEKGGA